MTVHDPVVTGSTGGSSGPLGGAGGTGAAAALATVAGPPASRGTRPSRRGWRRALRRDWQLYSLLVLPLLFLLVFRYLPMLGNVIAFRRFRPGRQHLRRRVGRACATSSCSSTTRRSGRSSRTR